MIDICLINGCEIQKVHVANTLWRRFRGLFHPDYKYGPGLLIYPCGSIHTFFMTEVIDVVFIAKTKKILSVRYGVMPNQMVAAPGSHYVLELRQGLAKKYAVKVGDQLEF